MSFGVDTLFPMRARVSRNSLISLRKHSALKIAVVLIFALGMWVGLFFMFLDAFHFLEKDMISDFKPLLVEILFAVFFLSLLILLMLSNAIIAYGSLFRSRETAFLFTRPVPAAHIFAYKQSETLLFSSWAFLFLALPLFVAYGVTEHAQWYYYAGSAGFFGVFALLPAALGGLITLLIGRFMPRSPKRILLFVVIVIALLGCTWAVFLTRAFKIGMEAPGTAWIRSVLGRLTLSQNHLLPSYWMGRGIQHLAAGELREAAYRFALLASTSLFFGMLGIQLARKLYVRAYHRVQAITRKRRNLLGRWFYRLIEKTLFGFDLETRTLIIKDLKTFLRDPIQWSQVLIFFGLLAVYFLNMRHLQYDLSNPLWNNMIGLLNLVATSLTLSTFTSRFIFPLISLEGRRFWVLGLLPIDRAVLIYSKFWFAFMGSFFISAGLMIISDLMLGAGIAVMILHGVTVLSICGGLSGLAVGLGALYPNLREDNPSKIVGGFGGTLNLICSIFFVAVMIALIALPYHAKFIGRGLDIKLLREISLPMALGAIVMAVLATTVPIWLGVRAIRRLET